MSDSNNGRIEALELALMRAWAAGDKKTLKRLLSRRFRVVIGSSAPVMLDKTSFVEAAGSRWAIGSFRIGTSVYSREYDGGAIFAAEVEMKARVDGRDCSGSWWMVDLWRKSVLTRNWQLVDRQLSRPDTGAVVPESIRALQLWR